MKKFEQPTKLKGGENVFDLMPKYNELPEEFTRGNTKWNDATSRWFFSGIQKSQFTVKEGIDADIAFRHIGRVISDWSPKHEHKEAAVAYLMSLWFKDVQLTA